MFLLLDFFLDLWSFWLGLLDFLRLAASGGQTQDPRLRRGCLRHLLLICAFSTWSFDFRFLFSPTFVFYTNLWIFTLGFLRLLEFSTWTFALFQFGLFYLDFIFSTSFLWIFIDFFTYFLNFLLLDSKSSWSFGLVILDFCTFPTWTFWFWVLFIFFRPPFFLNRLLDFWTISHI